MSTAKDLTSAPGYLQNMILYTLTDGLTQIYRDHVWESPSKNHLNNAESNLKIVAWPINLVEVAESLPISADKVAEFNALPLPRDTRAVVWYNYDQTKFDPLAPHYYVTRDHINKAYKVCGICGLEIFFDAKGVLA